MYEPRFYHSRYGSGDCRRGSRSKNRAFSDESDDFSKQKLAEYRQHLESGPLRDMRMYQKLPAFLDNPRMFSGYPELAVGVARDLFTIDGSVPELMRKKILRHGKKVGFINLIKDGMKGVTVL